MPDTSILTNLLTFCMLINRELFDEGRELVRPKDRTESISAVLHSIALITNNNNNNNNNNNQSIKGVNNESTLLPYSSLSAGHTARHWCHTGVCACCLEGRQSVPESATPITWHLTRNTQINNWIKTWMSFSFTGPRFDSHYYKSSLLTQKEKPQQLLE